MGQTLKYYPIHSELVILKREDMRKLLADYGLAVKSAILGMEENGTEARDLVGIKEFYREIQGASGLFSSYGWHTPFADSVYEVHNQEDNFLDSGFQVISS